MRVLSVVGNRPQFVKSGPVSTALRDAGIDEVVLHTGQHWDREMSAVFFEELGLGEPRYRLDLHTADPEAMKPGIREAVAAERPDWVLVYGDTNSTLAGAEAAAGVPVAHVEAGLRSFDLAMPEERNRIAVDRLAALLLCPDERSARQLASEGVAGRVEVVGDVMADAARIFGPLARERSGALDALGVDPGGYVLVTIHREANVRSDRLRRIVDGLNRLEEPIVFPAHPRTRAALEGMPRRFDVVDPLGYLDLTALASQARAIVTDSGGLQKEAYWYGVPCVTARPSTEWVDTVEQGANVLVDDDPEALARAVAAAEFPQDAPELYGDGHAAERIAGILVRAGGDRPARVSARWPTTSQSSAPATSACRSPPPSRRAAAACSSSTSFPRVVEGMNRGESHIEDVESDRLRPLVEQGLIRATADYRELREAEAILIALPTPLSRQREPDLSIVERATRGIAEVIREGQVVVLESTTWPGTTREVLQPILEAGSGLKAGEGFHLAMSPERVDPGREDWTTKTTPKILGGITPECTRRAADVYRKAVDTVHEVSSPEAAELTKLLENIFRSVNIALVNEIAQLCDRMSIDIWEVVGAAATKPFGFMPFKPGPGLGGHCIPIDPFYLTWKAREFGFYTEFIELAGKVNESMPYFCRSLVSQALNHHSQKAMSGSKVLVLGVAYKPDISDMRESPALKLISLLRNAGADVSYHDPHVPSFSEHGLELESVALEPGAYDCVVVVTDHSSIDYERLVDDAALVVDLRNATGTKGTASDNVFKL